MDDTISRQAVIDTFKPWLKVQKYSDDERNMLKAVLYKLKYFPSAESEIIRCKDCEYIRVGGVDDGLHWCYCDQTDCDTEYNGYCFRAKKR